MIDIELTPECVLRAVEEMSPAQRERLSMMLFSSCMVNDNIDYRYILNYCKDKITPEDALKGSIIEYNDPFGPATPEEDWEVLK